MVLFFGAIIFLGGFLLGYKLGKDDKIFNEQDIKLIKTTLGIKNKIKVFHTLEKKPETIENIEKAII